MMTPYDELHALVADLALFTRALPAAPAAWVLSDPLRAPTPREVVQAGRLAWAVYAAKNPGYADSWCRRHAVGIFANVARKFDRVEHGLPTPPMDDLVDLAVYSLLQLAWHLVNDPRAGARYAAGAAPEVLVAPPVPPGEGFAPSAEAVAYARGLLRALVWLERDNDALRARLADQAAMLEAPRD